MRNKKNRTETKDILEHALLAFAGICLVAGFVALFFNSITMQIEDEPAVRLLGQWLTDTFGLPYNWWLNRNMPATLHGLTISALIFCIILAKRRNRNM